MKIIDFIVQNVLTQAAVTISLIAFLGLILLFTECEGFEPSIQV